jgi:steroid 5-alpha reductase family enzyme
MLTEVASLPWLTLAVLLAAATLVWVLSLARRDASIVDVFWGPGFVVAAGMYRAPLGAPTPRSDLVLGLVTLWGLRLALHILWRSRGRGEDYRYREMRERDPRGFPLRSLATVFWLQAALIWAISAPLYPAVRSPTPAGLTGLDHLGVLAFLTGFLFESVSDWQLARFRSDRANAGRVLDRGLWRYTRHPNYFGDALVWWAFFCFAAATPGGWRTVHGPMLMTLLLMRVSGVTLLEKKLRETRPAYRRYADETRAFFPWLPRRRPPDDEVGR